MLQIISKKRFLKDLLEDFVDIHCHILPGIDDGSKSVDESIILIKKMKQLGIKQFIATPHVMQDFYPNDDLSIGNAYQSLIENLTSKRLNNTVINPSAEYMMDHHFENLVKQNHIFPLKENYVLVEMSYFQPPINLQEIIHAMLMKDYIPVLAHPERYSYYQNKKEFYKTLKQYGCLFQLNLLSLSDHYGKSIQKIVMYLLEENLIDFVATDVHNENHVNKLSDLILTKNQKSLLPQIIETTKKTFLVS
jgi:protein-tyrosine phosphatase